ncbi:MAG: hypothetical protein E7662_07675 [Ruminococcaceae bacterium]|nr:hypothetical protein [Oscillospiraceae bacterium]
MNEMLHAYYMENDQYAPRLTTDSLFLYGAADIGYDGIADKMARFIEKIQLKDAALWKEFVDLYRGNPDDDAGWRCEYWGKMMRGAAMTYLYTRDEELYQMLTETVIDMLSAQDDLGRFSTYSVEKEFDGWDIWGRKYIILAMLHYHEICRDDALKEQILEACSAHAQYIVDHIGWETEGKKNITAASRHWGGINSSSILEPMMRLYNATGNKNFFDFATYIIENGGSKNGNIFEFALKGEKYPFEYPDYKAYELMSCFEGLIEYYRVTHEAKWLTAVRNFVLLLRASDITVIGCSGCTHELLDHSAVRQTFTKYEGIMQETCVTVTWMKICSQMLLLTGESLYADEIERSAFNALYGAVNTEGCTTNMGFPFDSYSPLLAQKRGRKQGGVQKRPDGSVIYGCCACIGAAGTALVPLTNALLSRSGVAVNYYLSGTFTLPSPAGQPCTVITESGASPDGQAVMTVSLIGSEAFTLSLRIPGWSRAAEVRVNGREVPDVTAGEYLHIARTWSDGDVIEVDFGQPVIVYRGAVLEDDPASEHHAAIQVGALILARDARISDDVGKPIRLKLDANGDPIVKPASRPDFPTQGSWEVETADGVIRMIDYASAGKTWSDESRMECWMPTED